MATPISEQIAVVVKSRLEAITTGNGYETTQSGVIRPKRIETTQPKDYQITIAQGDKTPNEALSHPGNPPAICWDFPFTISGILRQSETDTTAQDTLKNTFEADVIKSLTSVSNWHTMGGLAINSTISNVEDYFDAEAEAGAFRVVLTVMYRVSENDPYTARA
jgi:hypothetical protein